MKKFHILGVLVIGVAIGVILVSLKNTSTYADFNEAMQSPDKEFHVVGKLDKLASQIYEPKINPDQFLFSMIDNKGVIKNVVLHKSKPQDFEKSEQIVLIGKMKGDDFHANDILMKCPSKYSDGKPQIN
jgi:cytochrome c-type biogenesis protein CcmE